MYDNLPLRAKLLLPFVAVMVISGGVGTIMLTRDSVNARNQAATARLAQVTDLARAGFSDARGGLLATARFVAGTAGVPDAIVSGDAARLRSLVPQVVENSASHEDRVFVVSPGGAVLLTVYRDAGGKVRTASGGTIKDRSLVSPGSEPFVGVVGASLTVSYPVRSSGGRHVGAVIASDDAGRIARDVASTAGAGAQITIFGAAGDVVGSSGATPLPFRIPGDGQRVALTRTKDSLQGLYAPIALSPGVDGTLAVALPGSSVVTPGAGSLPGLAALLGLLAVAVVVIGVRGTRRVTAPVGDLVKATQTLGSGDLSVRAAVHGYDEVGRLAEAFNSMAADLQRSYAELEQKVADRTAELSAANSELERSSEAKSQFLTMVSHELRTPLNAIIGFSSMLADPTLGRMPDKEKRHMASSIMEGGHHLLAIITDLLDVARIEAGKMRIEPRAVDVARVLGEAADLCAPLAKAKRIKLKVACERRLSRVVADRGRLKQIVLNLISNAIKYSDAGAHVEISAKTAGGFVELSVTDNGPGMTDQEAESIFRLFERGSASGKAEGAGVGLPLARMLAEMHGGRMWVDTAPGKGSAFRFTLPTTAVMSPVDDSEQGVA